jgi:S1-C subfamily serine protease
MNPGNSGGPLLNLDGDVIGMNSCGVSTSGGCIGLGFSIPSNLIKEVLKDLAEHKKPLRGHLDMLLFPVNASIAFELGLEKHQGVFVFAVAPQGPAGLAGFRPGDMILEVQGTPIMELGQVRTAIAFAKPGDTLTFLVRRGSEQITLLPTVGEALPASAQALKVENDLGLRVQPTLVHWKEAQDIQTGLLVTEIDTSGAAFRAGLRLGQIIIEANGRTLSSIEDLAEEVFKKTFLSLTIFHVLEDDKILSVDLFQ